MIDHVTLYFCNKTLGASLGLPDFFFIASQLQQNFLGHGITVELATADGKPFTTYGGVSVAVDKAIANIDKTGLLILAAIGGAISDGFLTDHESLYPKLRDWHAEGIPIMATGSANFLLAQAGLLDRRMTTANKHTQSQFAKRYPTVEICRDRSITESEGIYTCTGMDSSSYLLLFLLSQLSSEAVSKNIENIFSTEPGKKNAALNLIANQDSSRQDESIARIQQWLELHFSESISLELLASNANMSLRTLKRRFKEATTVAPLRYIQKLRMQQAREYLKHTDKNIAEIARLVGYEDAGHFSRLFKREHAQSPGQWRKKRERKKGSDK